MAVSLSFSSSSRNFKDVLCNALSELGLSDLQLVVKLCLISYSVCPRNRMLQGIYIYMAVCYRIVALVSSINLE